MKDLKRYSPESTDGITVQYLGFNYYIIRNGTWFSVIVESEATERGLERILAKNKLSRKHYIKMLMALGAERNDAVTLAKTVRDSGNTYYEGFWDFVRFLST